MAFPASPSNNDVHKEGNRAFVWDSTLGVWDQVRETDRTENKTITSDAIAQGNLSVVGDLVPSTPLSHRNLIINGGMQVWQRATAATTAIQDYPTVDRWKMYESTDGTYTSEKHTMSIVEKGITGHASAVKLIPTVADPDIESGQYAYIQNSIEAQNLQHLQYGSADAKTITLSFWVKSNVTGTWTIAINKNDGTQSIYVREYTIVAADTWEHKALTITPTAGSTSFITAAGGAIDDNNGRGMDVMFNLGFGTNYNSATTDTWNQSSKYSTTNHSTSASFMASTSNTFYLTGVQLELGSNATPFEHRTYADELTKCHRYCAVFGTGTTGCSSWVTGACANSTASGYFQYRLPVFPRAIPTIAISGQFIITDNHTSDHTFTGTVISTQPQSETIQGRVYLTSISGLTNQRVYFAPNGLGGTGKTIFLMEL